MKFCRWFIAMLLTLVPVSARAISLHWASGADTMSFAQPTRCVLVVRADAAEGRLPAEWRLLWLADSGGVNFAAEDTGLACASDTARVSTATPAATAADSAAHVLTTQLCSAGSVAGSTARFVLDQPGGSQTRFKAVALDPSDPESGRVIGSNEVTTNGGVDGEYAPVVLRASSVHRSLQLRVTAIGSGLTSATTMHLLAADSSWSLPLDVTSQTESSETGVAPVAALLPSCQAAVGSESGAVSMAVLPADLEPEPESPLSCQATYHEALLQPPPPRLGYTIQPKDFAFAKGFVDQSSNRFALHLFYIRHNYWYYQGPRVGWRPDLDEKNLGHIWTTDFNSWYGPAGLNSPDTVALTVRPGMFDALHVWAPTIIQRGPTFWMFYTGVRSDQPGGPQHQRIGAATSTDLVTWIPRDDALLTAPQVPWAMTVPNGDPYYGAQQLRDPFVMEDPVSPGGWIMYFVALDSCDAPCTPRMAVGAARSPDLIQWTPLSDPFSATQEPTFGGATNVVESPHVFMRNGRWWMPYTVNGDQVFFETTASSDPADTDPDHWTDPIWLRGVTEGEPAPLQYWHATEYLRINSKEYLAAFNDADISIDIKGVFPAADPEVDSLLLHCPEVAGAPNQDGSGGKARMRASRPGFGEPGVSFLIELPLRMAVRLAIHDIAGRRLATILDRELAVGITQARWDGRDRGGARVPSGVYFARLTFDGGTSVSKLVMLR